MVFLLRGFKKHTAFYFPEANKYGILPLLGWSKSLLPHSHGQCPEMGHQSYKLRFQPKKVSRIHFSIREDISVSKLTTLTMVPKPYERFIEKLKKGTKVHLEFTEILSMWEEEKYYSLGMEGKIDSFLSTVAWVQLSSNARRSQMF